MSLRVAIDLDGTVADLSRAMHDTAKRKFRKLRDAEPADAPSTADASPDDTTTSTPRPALADLGLSASDIDRLWTHLLKIQNFWASLDEMADGIVARIQALADERRWDVLFITTRPDAAGATTQNQSQEWLAAKGFRRPSVYVVKGSRGKVAAALDLDAVVDDRPENCLDVASTSRAKAILVWPRDASELGPGVSHHGVVVVPDIDAALQVLVDMDRDRRGGVARSIRRMFGGR